ncbi:MULTISPECIES: anti-sigma factor [unclassified Bradyrhizobium]|uniref:anti-sigma factor family protein n=1 Tax=unclassified Bradyrhizobium TaxID=2631580 RepID=UPI001FF8B3AA|nr:MULTISPECIES: anti-sigma factor [unclassified Bradyrhizobium]MCK1713000.1 anti-sigma factor [Bradyrhizobium sp. 143]MCK1724657.1 anti-sigma factor [Bradyrhizobium sp. 142]
MAALAVERKIAAEPDLRKLADEIAALKKVLAEKFPPETIPPRLRSRIEATFALETRQRMPNWAKIAASILVVAALSSTLTGIALRATAPQEIVVAELFDAHLRSLMAAQPTDVASSDQHTVKPWFNGRITQSPRVVDLAAQGFELVGGRVDVISRTPLSTLVYRRREHVISLTEISGRDQLDLPFDWRAENGFNMIRWSGRERSYVAISDLNVNELETFAKVFRGSAS